MFYKSFATYMFNLKEEEFYKDQKTQKNSKLQVRIELTTL